MDFGLQEVDVYDPNQPGVRRQARFWHRLSCASDWLIGLNSCSPAQIVATGSIMHTYA